MFHHRRICLTDFREGGCLVLPPPSVGSREKAHSELGKTDNFVFLDQICPKKVFQVQNRKRMSITIEFCIFELIYNHFHNILILFGVLPNFPFTKSETKRDYC